MAAVDPGAHKVRVSADGYFPLEQSYDVVEGQLRVIDAALRPRPARVRVHTEGGAQVTVDGRPAGLAPLARPLELEAGTHFVSVTRRGRRAWSREITVSRGDEVELQAGLQRSGQRSLSYVVLGTSAATLAAAGVTGLLAGAADSDAADLDKKRRAEGLTRAELADYQAAIGRRDDRLTATYALLGIGGALAAGGALLWFLDTPRPGAPPPEAPAGQPGPKAPDDGMHPVSAVPLWAPGGAGVALQGRF